MPPPTSNFLRTGQPDPRLAQSAATPFDATARQVLDQQVVDAQVLLAQLLVNGVVGSYVQVDPASPVDVAKGDVLCRSGVLARSSALVATSANVALAGGSVLGVATEAVAKGSRCPYAVLGVLPPEVTGLTPGLGIPGLARVSSVGRVEAVAAYALSDVPLGGVDSGGWLTLSSAPGAAGAAGTVRVPMVLQQLSTEVAANNDAIVGNRYVDVDDYVAGATSARFYALVARTVGLPSRVHVQVFNVTDVLALTGVEVATDSSTDTVVEFDLDLSSLIGAGKNWISIRLWSNDAGAAAMMVGELRFS